MYVVGFLSNFDGEILLEKIQADSKESAVRKFLVKHEWPEAELNGLSLGELCQFVAECDAYINVILAA